MIGAKRPITVVLCLIVAGCGTNVKELLDDESRTYWSAEQIVAAAEDLDLGLEEAVFDAESAKDEACEPISSAARERLYEGNWSAVERFWSDLTQFIVRLIPIQFVEECAEAHERYNRELAALRERLEALGIEAPRLDDEPFGRLRSEE